MRNTVWLLILCAVIGGPACAVPVAIVFDEQVRGVNNIAGSWVDPGSGEEALVNLLREAGHQVKDPQAVRAQLLRDQALLVLGGDAKAAAAAGTRLDTEYLITGKGYAKSAGQVAGSSMKSIQANVQLALVETRSGAILSSATGQAAKPHVDEVTGGAAAIAAAMEIAGRKLLAVLATRTQGNAAAAQAPRKVRLAISGLKSYRHFLAVQDWTEQASTGWLQTERESYQVGSGELDLSTTCTGPQLARALAQAEFDGFVVNPVEVQADAVIAKAVARDTPPAGAEAEPPLSFDEAAQQVNLAGLTFTQNAQTGAYETPAGDRLTRARETGAWTLVRPSGGTARFSAAGHLVTAQAKPAARPGYRLADDAGDDAADPAAGERAQAYLDQRGKLTSKGGKVGAADEGGAEVRATVGEDVAAREQARRETREARDGAHTGLAEASMAIAGAEDPLDKLIKNFSQVSDAARGAGEAIDESMKLEQQIISIRESRKERTE